MTHAQNKVNWCLKKAQKELAEKQVHKGLVEIKPDNEKAKAYITKAEHYLKATEILKREGFSDISASTVFYAMYHALLAIITKQGYESRNQECTFALMQNLIEEKQIDFDIKLLERITELDVKDMHKLTSSEIREQYQYGTELALKEEALYNELVTLAIKIIGAAKEIAEV